MMAFDGFLQLAEFFFGYVVPHVLGAGFEAVEAIADLSGQFADLCVHHVDGFLQTLIVLQAVVLAQFGQRFEKIVDDRRD